MKLLSLSGALLVVVLMSTRSCDDPLFDGKNCVGNCYVVQGKVTDSVTGQGIANVGLKLFYHYGGYSPFGGSTRLFVETRTRQDGEYSVTFDGTKYKETNGYFSLEAKHSNYFTGRYNDAITYDDFRPRNMSFNQPVSINFVMFLPAYIKFRVKAANASTVKYLSLNTYYGNYSGVGHRITVRPGLDTTILQKTAGDIQSRINWEIMPQAIQKKDSLTVGKKATVEYTIDL